MYLKIDMTSILRYIPVFLQNHQSASGPFWRDTKEVPEPLGTTITFVLFILESSPERRVGDNETSILFQRLQLLRIANNDARLILRRKLNGATT